MKNRGVSPVVSVILLVAIVVILAATISAFVLNFGSNVNTEPPFVAQSSGDVDPADGGDGGILTVTHEGGDPIQVSNIEIVVDATDTCGKRARVVNLPADYSYGGDQLDDENFVNGASSILVKGHPFAFEEWNIGPLGDHTDNAFEVGESFQLRLSGDQSDGCPVQQGDRLRVAVVHTPSETVVISQKITV